MDKAIKTILSIIAGDRAHLQSPKSVHVYQMKHHGLLLVSLDIGDNPALEVEGFSIRRVFMVCSTDDSCVVELLENSLWIYEHLGEKALFQEIRSEDSLHRLLGFRSGVMRIWIDAKETDDSSRISQFLQKVLQSGTEQRA